MNRHAFPCAALGLAFALGALPAVAQPLLRAADEFATEGARVEIAGLAGTTTLLQGLPVPTRSAALALGTRTEAYAQDGWLTAHRIQMGRIGWGSGGPGGGLLLRGGGRASLDHPPWRRPVRARRHRGRLRRQPAAALRLGHRSPPPARLPAARTPPAPGGRATRSEPWFSGVSMQISASALSDLRPRSALTSPSTFIACASTWRPRASSTATAPRTSCAAPSVATSAPSPCARRANMPPWISSPPTRAPRCPSSSFARGFSWAAPRSSPELRLRVIGQGPRTHAISPSFSGVFRAAPRNARLTAVPRADYGPPSNGR
jgi:hypothetical protein